MQIWKKPILNSFIKSHTVKHSCWGKVLSVQLQHGNPVIYYLNELSADQEFKSTVYVVETGQEHVNDTWRYLNTLMLDDGKYVFHYYADH